MSSVEKAERSRLRGKRILGSAGFQTAGPISYDFGADTLTVESCSIPNAKDGRAVPTTVFVKRYHYRLMIPQRNPSQIILTPIGVQGGKDETWIYEFRDGWLWMCPDDVAAPKNRSSLHPGNDGSGWLIGLEPSKQN
jgi:hypothetical protein